HLKGPRIKAELLPLLGVSPLVGRAFAAEEFQPGHDQVALISHRLWQSRFGADPQIIGQAITLDQRSYTVVGVTPPRFDFFPEADLLTTPCARRSGAWIPISPFSGSAPCKRGWTNSMRPGVSTCCSSAPLRSSPCCSRLSGCTACWHTPSRSARARSAFAWRLAHKRTTCCG